ncbi:HEAT repeat domain-containing protein [Photobacterium sp. BZF1]|uniref:tetratricopeptide repeat protein n=1 Tax=Photobacterium sp. BZF1 TaxID=1904457 RepID=UPI001653BDB8|nr:tetratricopeptide repeat protein [Photobacterium sp. BZF1]MBC7003163.1 HEAT repeat domain-containing protein [Photobacterium sp. BZF1]
MMKRVIELVLGVSLAVLIIAMPSYAQDVAPALDSAEQLNPQQQRQAQQIQQWVMIAQDRNQNDERRADALRQLARYPNQNSLVAVARSLQDENPRVREAAVVAAEPYQFANRWRMLSPLLKDSDQHVRLAATTNLIRNYGEMTPEQQADMEKPANGLIKYLKGKSDPSSQLLLADIYRWYQQFDDANRTYNTLLDGDKQNPQIWLGLADNYRAQGEDQQANKVLVQAQNVLPEEANLFYSQALTLVRLEEKKQAADAMEKATELSPDNSYFWYLNGVLQEAFNVDQATASFEKAYEISGAPEQLYAVCDIYVRHGNLKADSCLESLAKVAPAFVIEELKSKRG